MASCQQYQLKIIGQWTKRLTREEVLKVYPTIQKKSFFDEFLELMMSHYSTLILVDGADAIHKTKMIRGNCRHSDSEPMDGVRGKYSLIEDISQDDWDKLIKKCHPDAERLISIIIGGVVHAPDGEQEVYSTLAVFN